MSRKAHYSPGSPSSNTNNTDVDELPRSVAS